MTSVLLISGSTRTGSTNGAALAAVIDGWAAAERYGGLTDLPHFNPDLDADPLPPVVAELRSRIGTADAVLFCTPEYAGALPGSLKNLLDWTIGGGQLSGKPAGWLNVSDRGAAGAYAELATVLGYAGAVVIEAACQHIPVSRSALDGSGRITDSGLRARLVAAARAVLV